MPDNRRRSTRYLQSSTPHASRLLQSSLRPSGFLNMLSGRNYQGYIRADESVLEEEEGEQDEHTEITRSPFTDQRWGESSRMTVLHPNQDQPRSHDDSSDDEIPQSFMVEAGPSAKKPIPHNARTKSSAKHSSKPSVARPLLPISNDDTLNLPPRPSEIDPPMSADLKPETPRKQMRGLDAYERALWNWVNVYDLDVFLQDVYRYYEGKGIYSIALARGLHLL